MGLSTGIITTSTKDLVKRLREINYSELKWTQLGATVFVSNLQLLNGVDLIAGFVTVHADAVLSLIIAFHAVVE